MKDSNLCQRVNANDHLLWYNGGLMKNKLNSSLASEYDVLTKWVMDGEWWKGATKADMSCMVGGEARSLSDLQVRILERSIEVAKRVDEVVI